MWNTYRALVGVSMLALVGLLPIVTVAQQLPPTGCFTYWNWKEAKPLWPDDHFHGGDGEEPEVGWTFEGGYDAEDVNSHEWFEPGYADDAHDECAN